MIGFSICRYLSKGAAYPHADCGTLDARDYHWAGRPRMLPRRPCRVVRVPYHCVHGGDSGNIRDAVSTMRQC